MAIFPCSTSLSDPAYHRRILDPHFSHLDWLYWLLTGLTISLTIAVTTTSHPHMLHTPINPSCALWPVILALFSKTQIWLDHSSASTFYRSPTAFRMKSVSSLSLPQHCPLSLLHLADTVQADTLPSPKSFCSIPVVLHATVGAMRPGQAQPQVILSLFHTRAFRFMTCGFSNFTK